MSSQSSFLMDEEIASEDEGVSITNSGNTEGGMGGHNLQPDTTPQRDFACNVAFMLSGHT